MHSLVFWSTHLPVKSRFARTMHSYASTYQIIWIVWCCTYSVQSSHSEKNCWLTLPLSFSAKLSCVSSARSSDCWFLQIFRGPQTGRYFSVHIHEEESLWTYSHTRHTIEELMVFVIRLYSVQYSFRVPLSVTTVQTTVWWVRERVPNTVRTGTRPIVDLNIPTARPIVWTGRR